MSTSISMRFKSVFIPAMRRSSQQPESPTAVSGPSTAPNANLATSCQPEPVNQAITSRASTVGSSTIHISVDDSHRDSDSYAIRQTRRVDSASMQRSRPRSPSSPQGSPDNRPIAYIRVPTVPGVGAHALGK